MLISGRMRIYPSQLTWTTISRLLCTYMWLFPCDWVTPNVQFKWLQLVSVSFSTDFVLAPGYWLLWRHYGMCKFLLESFNVYIRIRMLVWCWTCDIMPLELVMQIWVYFELLKSLLTDCLGYQLSAGRNWQKQDHQPYVLHALKNCLSYMLGKLCFILKVLVPWGDASSLCLSSLCVS